MRKYPMGVVDWVVPRLEIEWVGSYPIRSFEGVEEKYRERESYEWDSFSDHKEHVIVCPPRKFSATISKEGPIANFKVVNLQQF